MRQECIRDTRKAEKREECLGLKTIFFDARKDYGQDDQGTNVDGQSLAVNYPQW